MGHVAWTCPLGSAVRPGSQPPPEDQLRIVRSLFLRLAVAAALTALTPTVAAAQSLAGSRASLDIQNRMAKAHDFSVLVTAAQVRKFVSSGYLVPVRANGDFALHDVSFPYARPQVELFVRRLASQYRAACGEVLVVTSLTRPAGAQPRNASDRSVHPAGMAVDLRVSNRSECRRWLERVLLDLERQGVLEATRERRPLHYHIAVFPDPYLRWVEGRGAVQMAAVTASKEKPAPAPSQQLVRYEVRSGDSLWNIARQHGTTVAMLRAKNELLSSRILPGQVLEVPVSN